jgi:uncharacterized damage-inducible protein DinB
MPAGIMASVIRLNSRLFLNCLTDVSDAAATTRPDGSTNNMAFIGCHLVDARHFMTVQLGLSSPHPFGDRYMDVQRIEDMTDFPAVAEIRGGWLGLAPALEACVARLSREDLGRPSRARFPIEDPTVAGMIAFLIQHESYHIGQLALLRKFTGYPAMSYA